MIKKYDLIVVGELNVDIIFDKIEKLPKIGTEIISKDMQLVMGSSSAIFASNISTLGMGVAFLGKMGDDMFGGLLAESLEAKKVSTEFVIKNRLLTTGVTVVLNYGEDRSMVTYPGAMELLKGADVSNEILSFAKHLHISSIFLQPLILKDLKDILLRAKALGMTTSIDPQWDPSEKWNFNKEQVLPLVDIFLPNYKEFLMITESRNVNEGLKKVAPYANTIVIKNGDKGSFLYSNGKQVNNSGFFNNKIIDCIGAGDSFDAGFINKYLQGESMEKCLEFANLCGAINTTSVGGTGAFVSKCSVIKTAKEIFGYNIM